MNAKLKTALVIYLSLSGCASRHQMMQGTIAMKLSDSLAHICLGEKAVSGGERVALYRNECVGRKICEKVLIGNGKITSVLNEHYSEVTLDHPIKFREGDFVEIVR